jgi:hypothetical protein
MTAAGNGQLEAVNMKALLISVGQQPKNKEKSIKVETNAKALYQTRIHKL